MLNPFAIEKELFVKTAKLSTILRILKGAIAVSVVGKKEEGRFFTPAVVEQCMEMKQAMQVSKMYVCKICGKEFNEGRKLGGHVSRAHKGSQISILSDQPSEESCSETYRPRCTKRRRVKVEQVEDESETRIKKVKIEEPIFEEA